MKESLRFRLDQMSDRFEEVTAMLSEPETMNDNKKFRELSVEHSDLSALVDVWGKYRQAEEDLATAEEMLSDSAGDGDMKEMAQEEIQAAKDTINALEDVLNVMMLPKDPNDKVPAFLEIRAGTGGDEAAIFAGDLFRMYERYAQAQGWQVEVLSMNEGEHGGYKEIISRVSGTGVYGRLKFESGAHRVQRVPETESQGRVHTSACTVAVMPEVEIDDTVDINPADLRIDTYRASGAGGQHINKTSSAIRITHFPTGIVVTCQNERSQHMNKDKAMQMLKAKLYLLKQQEAEAKLSGIRGEVTDIGWGNQIRSYVMQPYTMVKDHRTNEETGNVDAVLDGDIDPFINAYLKWIALSKKPVES